MESTYSILLTGASGYLGGSVLNALLTSRKIAAHNVQISAMARGSAQADWLESQGVRPMLYNDFTETDLLSAAASQHDLIINCASGFATEAAVALISGLGERKKATGRNTWMIHTSGTTSISDKPATGHYAEPLRLDDSIDDIYKYLAKLQDLEVYQQRTTDLAVQEAAHLNGVRTYTIMAPPVYGTGTGHFRILSTQIPRLIHKALDFGYSFYVGDGMGLKDSVHVTDLAELFCLQLLEILENPDDAAAGESTILFAGTAQFRWRDLSAGLAKVGHELGQFEEDTPRSLSIDDAVQLGVAPTKQLVELTFASSSSTKASKAVALAWRPTKSAKDWDENLRAVFVKVLESRE